MSAAASSSCLTLSTSDTLIQTTQLPPCPSFSLNSSAVSIFLGKRTQWILQPTAPPSLFPLWSEFRVFIETVPLCISETLIAVSFTLSVWGESGGGRKWYWSCWARQQRLESNSLCNREQRVAECRQVTPLQSLKGNGGEKRKVEIGFPFTF